MLSETICRSAESDERITDHARLCRVVKGRTLQTLPVMCQRAGWLGRFCPAVFVADVSVCWAKIEGGDGLLEQLGGFEPP